MEYQKIVNLLDSASNKPSKFRTRNWAETNDGIRNAYCPNKQIRFKTTMLRSSLCNYSDAYTLVKGNISVNNAAAAGAAANNVTKTVIFKICAPLTNCKWKINNTQIDNAEYIDIVTPSITYLKTSGSLWQCCKEIPALNNDNIIVDFTTTNTTDSFKFITKITGQTNNDGEINGVEIMVPLKYLSSFWRTL